MPQELAPAFRQLTLATRSKFEEQSPILVLTREHFRELVQIKGVKAKGQCLLILITEECKK